MTGLVVVESARGPLRAALVGEQVKYSHKDVAFVAAHIEEYTSAWLNPGASTRAILERLAIEKFNLKHNRPACMCYCRHEACERWRISVGGYGREINLGDDVGVEIGRTAMIHPPSPPAELLDFARVSHQHFKSRGMQVAYLNGLARPTVIEGEWHEVKRLGRAA